jgi:hypothetical protein
MREECVLNLLRRYRFEGKVIDHMVHHNKFGRRRSIIGFASEERCLSKYLSSDK